MADSPEMQTAYRFAASRSGAGELRVFVPYTTGELTQAALAEAGVLLRNLAVETTLLAVQSCPSRSRWNGPQWRPSSWNEGR